MVTKLRDPEVPHDCLVGEVVVGVQEIPLDYVSVLLVLLFQHLLRLVIFRAAKKEDQLGDHSRDIWVTP